MENYSLSTTATVLAALISAYLADKQLRSSLNYSHSSSLVYIKQALRSTIALIEGGGSRLYRTVVALLFLFVFHIALLATLDKVTFEIAFNFLSFNATDFIYFSCASLLIAIWSLNQSLFFIKLANRLTTALGMVYLFISDFILSLIIFALGSSFFVAAWSIYNRQPTNYDATIFVHKECQDSCVYEISYALVDQKITPLYFSASIPESTEGTPESIYSILLKSDFVAGAKFIYLDQQEEEAFSSILARDRYDLTPVGKLEISFDITSVSGSFLSHFTHALRHSLDDYWRYLRFEFQYFAFRNIRQTDFETVDDGPFWAFDLFSESEYFMSVVPDETLRTELLNSNMSKETLLSKLDRLGSDFNVDEFDFLKMFSFVTWRTNTMLSDTTVVYADDPQTYILQISRINEKLKVGEASNAKGIIPTTPLLLASISFSSLFILFLVARALGWLTMFASSAFGSKIRTNPILAGTSLILLISILM